MRVGITLPQFRPSPEAALAAAAEAEAAGLDGVFVFDHLWAIGQPDRPALSCFPLMGALAVETSRVTVGSLVARVSLLPDAVLVHAFETLHRMLGSRLVAGLGAGDRLSVAENEAYGVPYPSHTERLARLAAAAAGTRSLGIDTWVGGLSAAVRAVAHAERVTLNLWGVTAEEVAAVDGLQVTWGGPVPRDVEGIAALLAHLAEAGAAWAVCAPPFPAGDPAPVVRLIADAVRVARG